MDNRRETPTVPRDKVIFCETVPGAFSFLATEYGFTLAQENECLFTARSKDCLVRVYLEWGDIAVTLQPSDVHQIQGPRAPARELGLAIILACLDIKIEWPGGLVTKPEELTTRIHQLATLLRTHCVPLLQGDFSNWSRFEAYGESLVGTWKEEQQRLVTDARLRDIRSKAESAFRKGDYVTAIDLYGSVGKNLTPAELRKIEYAKKQLKNLANRDSLRICTTSLSPFLPVNDPHYNTIERSVLDFSRVR